MLIKAQELIGYRFHLVGEVVGKCSDLLFDDRVWRVRYFVVDSPDVLAAHQRLALVRFVESIDHDDQTIHLKPSFADSRMELVDCPPVSLQSSINLFRRFGMSYDWIDGALAIHVPKQCLIAGNNAAEAERLSKHNHLRSVAEVL